MAFVRGGAYACCDEPIKQVEDEATHRISECNAKRIRIKESVRKEIISSQDGRCLYCLYKLGIVIENEKTFKKIRLKIHIDHFIPWSHLQTNNGEMIASCQICNGIKSNLMFDSIDSARVDIRNKREQRGWPNNGMLSVFLSHAESL